MFVIEDVTGSGKTEAALILANRLLSCGAASGLYFALPTMATANAMFTRLSHNYRALFEDETRPSIVLAHGARHLSDEFRQTLTRSSSASHGTNPDSTVSAEAHCSAWLADNKKKALLAEIGVGTIDQALLATLPSRHHSLRMLGLLGKILIVDEVHACDAYMNSLLSNLLKAHARSGGSSILLSASLTAEQRANLFSAYGHVIDADPATPSGYPLISALTPSEFSELEVPTRKSVERRTRTIYLHKIADVWDVIQKAIKNKKSVCWIRNTVEDAQSAYNEAESQLIRSSLFHARFTMGDRLDIEQATIDTFGPSSSRTTRCGRLLIATQVVEQSLDLDFDVMISDLAPIDSLIQRAGRLCRHTRDLHGNRVDGADERGTPTMYIFGPRYTSSPSENWYTSYFPKAAYVYPNHGHLWLTAKWIDSVDSFHMPKDARAMMSAIYDNDDYPTALLNHVASAEGKANADRGLGRFNSLNLDAGYMRTVENFRDESKSPTRLGDETVTVYLALSDANGIRPWYQSKDQRWEYSAVQIRAFYIDKTAEQHQHLADLLPDGGKFSALVILNQTSDGTWISNVSGQEERTSSLIYSPLTGARFQPHSI